MAGRFLPQNLPPLQDGRRLTPLFERYFRSLIDVPAWLGIEEVVNQAASISGKPIVVVGTLQAGVYRLSYYTRITQAAGTSSALTIQFRWTDGGVAQTVTGAVINGNTTTTVQQDRLMLRVDRDTSIVYDTTYASVGSPSMQYRFNVALERLA